MSYRYFDKIEMHPNYPYSSSFHTKTRRANSPNLIIRLSDKQDQQETSIFLPFCIFLLTKLNNYRQNFACFYREILG
ncbi:MAG: hypothetical protein EWV64_02535 [Microcystis flos-aquae Ma_QC_C_20070823_S18]|uniref:Uncharacterized protein n=1 Tax=Microcystis flos-aquae Mf_QC_C_20070823_S10D TaxID=2486236 RepID=A0A552KJ74_9CHRO|nr:MAG: hypothetical protein EWV64_02535 [Microcystis flos-aquae Ma_QC_C_20070823_S18]TRU01400.1 MAG: hypothetical protein EWV65_04555 [Microcystis flos-aquae Ma_QC_C_20070823_S18D]TRV07815.1 MAG: hypothetical protein EWV45_19020 [Microcystis flos-aquae Mf_QC_C_20070823_S10D]TRV28253.1 MAG: hypothetical protein EWV72_02785 [Microcystis flos-aquae Mf_QC_C_20070823_S10]TRV32165.1 MAG: hypothetical protein EWV71_18740 [Microcystis flos-aquae Mf_QC_C_20070823_S20D]TRV35151.1 MAG: hypothetical prot